MKVIYIFEQRFPYETDKVSFGYEVFWRHGWEVEIWVLTEWLLHISEQDISKDIRLDTSGYVCFCRKEEDFIKCLQRVQGEEIFCICYPYHAYNKNSYYIRRLLNHYKISFANLTESPGFDQYLKKKVPVTWSGAVNKILRVMILGNGYYFVQWLLSGCRNTAWIDKIGDTFYRLIGPIRYKAEYNFITTELAWYFCPNIFEKWNKNNLLIHATSYSEYLQTRDQKGLQIGKYVVFLDQGLINRDNVFLATGDDVPIRDKKAYVEDLCYLFEQVEAYYNCPVVIAAHPKASYKGNEFDGRKMFFGQTKQLVKDAKLVINQCSTAFFLCVLNKKDFLDIYTREMWETPSKQWKIYYEGFDLVGCKLLDISERERVKCFEKYVCHYHDDRFRQIIKAGIISEDSHCRDKVFYENVYDAINEWRANHISRGKNKK